MDQSGSTGGQGAPTEPPTGWSAPPPPPAQPGPSGLVYGDFTTRFIALIVDLIIVGIATQIVFYILGIFGIRVFSFDAIGVQLGYNPIVGIIFALIGSAISAGYFVYLWTKRRATFGMQVLKLQVGDAGSGTTLTQEQAIKRWLALGGIFGLAQGLIGFPFISFLIFLAAVAWPIFLGYTTAQSPTKQGWHDVFAHTMVVKAAS